jgi:polysaccharide export outer membrane protein
LDVTVVDEPDLTRSYVVGPDGSLELPLVGRVTADGLTPNALADEVAVALGNSYLRHPRVLSDVQALQRVRLDDGDSIFVPEAQFFYMLGDVRNPGTCMCCSQE